MLKMFDGQRTLPNMLKTCDCDEGTLESWHPLALAAKANDADAPNWNQAMNGPIQLQNTMFQQLLPRTGCISGAG